MTDSTNYNPQWQELIGDLLVYQQREECLGIAEQVLDPLSNADKNELRRLAEVEIQ